MNQASRSVNEALRAGETQRTYTEGRGASVSVVRVVIAGGGNSQKSSLFILHAIIAGALAIRLTLLLEFPGQASEVCARTVLILNRSRLGFVGGEGLIGDIGVRIAVGHSSEVGRDGTYNTRRTIRQNAAMGTAAAGRRWSRSTGDRAAKTGGSGKRHHRVGRTRSRGTTALLGMEGGHSCSADCGCIKHRGCRGELSPIGLAAS